MTPGTTFVLLFGFVASDTAALMSAFMKSGFQWNVGAIF
jgi:hypothetical protein